MTANHFWHDLLSLTKPKITLMTMIVSLGSMLLAPVHPTLVQGLLALLGIAFLVSGSSAFNMYMEREYDGLMSRTKNRALPAKRLSPFWAIVIGSLCSVFGILALYFGSSPLTVWLGIFSLVAYVLIYTPLKRVTSLSLIVGAIPGAMPALLGYTAALGQIDNASLALFGVARFSKPEA